MRIVLIGAGRLGTNLGLALTKAGHTVMAVYSHTLPAAQALTEKTGGVATDDLSALPQEADLFIVSVKDAVLLSVITQVVIGREDQRFVHTAGSMPMSLFEGKVQHYGVFYPMQTFSKERLVDFCQLSIFVEGSDKQTTDVVKELALSLTQKVFELSSDERKYLHLAAVFACNFVNHCYAISADILEQHGLPFDVMLPLIDETARKVHELHPYDAQTGPAVRYDENVIRMQASLLETDPLVKDIYERLSNDIHQKSKKS